MFSLEFSYLNYRRTGSVKYSYKLEGFDDHWHDIGHSNLATFTNLNPGNYTLFVRVQGEAVSTGAFSKIDIRIPSSPWKSWWAYCLYGIAATIFIYLIANNMIRQVELKSAKNLNDELRKLNDMKDAFLANTSHELRTPLNGIIGIADTLTEHYEADDFASQRLKLICSSGRRLACLINDILDYSKLANRNLNLDKSNIDLREITDGVFTLLEPLSSVKSIDLINEISEDKVFVFADENRLQQILINLIGNGIKYTKQGSVKVGSYIDSGLVNIYVEDTGIGIAQDQKESIFEAFEQIQSSNSREYAGTGLGLAITRQLVELHAGRIWVEPLDIGSRFVFTLKVGKEDLCNQKLSKSTKSSGNHKLRFGSELPSQIGSRKSPEILTIEGVPRSAEDQTVLIVDDDAVNRMVLSGILGLHCYKILEAESGAEAIEKVAKHPEIDLVVMDVMMPNMTGYEATEKIRQTHAMHSLPVIFLTAKRGDEQELVRCFDAGGNDFLTKPVSKHELLPRVASHLRVHTVVRQLIFDLQAMKSKLDK